MGLYTWSALYTAQIGCINIQSPIWPWDTASLLINHSRIPRRKTDSGVPLIYVLVTVLMSRLLLVKSDRAGRRGWTWRSASWVHILSLSPSPNALLHPSSFHSAVACVALTWFCLILDTCGGTTPHVSNSRPGGQIGPWHNYIRPARWFLIFY